MFLSAKENSHEVIKNIYLNINKNIHLKCHIIDTTCPKWTNDAKPCLWKAYDIKTSKE